MIENKWVKPFAKPKQNKLMEEKSKKRSEWNENIIFIWINLIDSIDDNNNNRELFIYSLIYSSLFEFGFWFWSDSDR